jgi:hypothetical protein
MIIIVVAAMIYMFQTFGGTGDKIEGVAQKTSVITEINNIKSGLKFAARAGRIADENTEVNDVDYYTALHGLAVESYFAEQMNEQIRTDANGALRNDDDFNVYSAISFGGNSANADGTGAMLISLVADVPNAVPGIYVDLTNGSLADNAGFLESEIANDLRSIATIDRTALTATAGALPNDGTPLERRTPEPNGEGGANNDGIFIIYFNDFGSNEVVRDNTTIN